MSRHVTPDHPETTGKQILNLVVYLLLPLVPELLGLRARKKKKLVSVAFVFRIFGVLQM